MLQQLTAGLLPFIWHIGLSTALVLFCVIVIYLSASLKTKVVFLVIALLAIGGDVCYLVGAHNGYQRCTAQEAVVQTQVDNVVTQAVKPVKPHRSILHPFGGVRYDQWDRNWKN